MGIWIAKVWGVIYEAKICHAFLWKRKASNQEIWFCETSKVLSLKKVINRFGYSLPNILLLSLYIVRPSKWPNIFDQVLLKKNVIPVFWFQILISKLELILYCKKISGICFRNSPWKWFPWNPFLSFVSSRKILRQFKFILYDFFTLMQVSTWF